MNRLHASWAVAVVLVTACAGTARATPILYAAADDVLYTLNTTTGAVDSVIGPIALEVTGLAFHPTTGVLYGTTSNLSPSNPRSLITIDPNTGVGTLIGSTSGHVMTDIAFDSSGTLYGWSGWRDRGTSDLNTINLTTGAATIVGDFGGDTSGNGLAFDSSGTLYADLRFPVPGSTHTINPATGLATGTIAKIGVSSSSFFNAMAYDPDTGLLFGMSRQNPGFTLFTMDPNTGVVTQLGVEQFSIRFDALAFVTTAIPEPSSLALLAFGAIGLVASRRILRRTRSEC